MAIVNMVARVIMGEDECRIWRIWWNSIHTRKSDCEMMFELLSNLQIATFAAKLIR